MTASVFRKVGFASLIMMASILLSRVVGLVREMVIAYAGGAGAGVDAYQVAFVLPEILNHIVASGFLSVTFIPIFSTYLAEDREKEGWEVFSVVFTCFGGALLALILVAMAFTPKLVPLLAPGLTDPDTLAEAVRMTRIILPAQFFFFAGGLFMAVQFAKEKFAVPALAPLLYNLGIIFGGIFLAGRRGMEGFAWGVLAGAFLGNFALQYFGALRAGMILRLTFDFRHPDLKKYIFLTLPLMLGLTMTFSAEFFLKFFGSFLPEGRIAALNYSLRVMLILVGVLGQAVGVASFPFMARLAAENRMDEMNRLLNAALKFLSLVIPFSALFIVLRHEIILLLFQRGRFDAAATDLTARVLTFMMTGAFAFAVQTVVVRGYYAVKNTLFPALFGTLAVLLSVPVYVYAMRAMGVRGVALAVSLSAAFQATLLYELWNRRTENAGRGDVYRCYGKMLVTGGLIWAALYGFREMLLFRIPADGFMNAMVICAITGLVFLFLLTGAGRLFRIREIDDVMKRLANRLKGRLG